MPVTLMPGAARKRQRRPSRSACRARASIVVPFEVDARTLRRAVERRCRSGICQRRRSRRRTCSRAPRSSSRSRSPSERDRNAHAAFLEALARRPRREQQERALRAEQVGHAHRAQLGAVEPIRRKRDRHAQHRAPDAVLAENRPERLRLPKQAQLRLVRAECGSGRASKKPLDRSDARRREQRQVGPPIAIEEIEDVVARRMRAGAERRPGDRRDRRERRPQPPVAARLARASRSSAAGPPS